jgi:hypothetical protein
MSDDELTYDDLRDDLREREITVAKLADDDPRKAVLRTFLGRLQELVTLIENGEIELAEAAKLVELLQAILRKAR